MGQENAQSVCLDCGELVSPPPSTAPPPAFTAFTARELYCSTCAAPVSFRVLPQLDGGELYLCETCDSEVGRKTATPSATPPPPSGIGAQPRSPNGASVTDGGAENGEEDKSKALQAGDWCYLLSADGVQQNAEPYLIASLETGPDGQQYARFYETDVGWLLARCEWADPPAAADGAAEVHADTINPEGVNIDDTTRVHAGSSTATTLHTPPASGTSGTSSIVAQPGSPGGAAYHSAENMEGETTQGLQAGDWVSLCKANGDRQYLEPCQVHTIDFRPDGTPYARFLNMGVEWPLAQCERTNPPAPVAPPDDVEKV